MIEVNWLGPIGHIVKIKMVDGNNQSILSYIIYVQIKSRTY